MDGFDLFKKLGSGARFNYKRFRQDAERLHILKPKPIGIENKHGTVKHEDEDKLQDNKEAQSDNDSESSSEENSDSEDENSNQNQDTSSESDSLDLSSSDSDEAEETKPESELKLLGDMVAQGDSTVNLKTDAVKKKKKKKKIFSTEKLAALKQEKVNHIRKVHRVSAVGTDVPHPIDTFEELGTEYKFHPQILQNIKTAGYQQPTPIQIQAIPVMLHRREVMACAPTGSGKTAAFILPILHHLKEPRNQGIRALTLAPTRELAKQTYREFQRLSEGMDFKLLYIDKVSKDPSRLKKALKKIDILVSTPNRLIYLLQQDPPVISLSSVQWLVVDESDKLFEEGKSGFRDQLATIYKACDGTEVRRAMFSATFTFDVEEWCRLNLDNVIQVYIGVRNAATKTVEQSLLFCGAETGKLLAMRDIIRQGIQPPVLVFVQSKDRAKDLFHELLYDGMNVDVIHADRTQQQRDNVIRCFRERKIWILICTELMGRGIDFKGVNLVINYDFPNSAISYIHRIGRTGRAGRQGKAITFFTEDDAVNLKSIANVMITAGCPVPDYMLKMKKPERKVRKLLSKGSLHRNRISTTARYDIQQASRLRNMITGTKMRKVYQQSGNINDENRKRKHTDSQDISVKRFKSDSDKNTLHKKKFTKGLKFKKLGQTFQPVSQSGKEKKSQGKDGQKKQKKDGQKKLKKDGEKKQKKDGQKKQVKGGKKTLLKKGKVKTGKKKAPTGS